MEKQHMEVMLFIEKSYPKFSGKSHPKRRLLANCLIKLTEDERMSEDIFALTMNIFDRFISQTSSMNIEDRQSFLIALCCYNLAKKLRTNTSINNENEQLPLIFSHENYSDDEIFNTEETISQTLDWDFAYFVPHDYLQLLFQSFLPIHDRTYLYAHVHIFLSIAIGELNTMTIRPSLLACACIKAAIKGLSIPSPSQLDQLFIRLIQCQKSELISTQHTIEQHFQSLLKTITPSPRRRCLALIDTSPQQQQQRTKVK